MNSNKPSYPLRKYDNLKRLIYVDWNGIERCIYKYWDDTKKVKIKYRLYHQETSFDAYDKSGNTVMSYASGSFDVNFPRIWSNKNGDVGFQVEKSKIINWSKCAKSKVREEMSWKYKLNLIFNQ